MIDKTILKKNPISPTILKITAQGIGLLSVILAFFFRWGILSRLGIVPKDICSYQTMTKYLTQGGNPNAWRNDFDYSFPVVHCFADVKDKKILDLFIKKGGDLNYKYWGGHTVFTQVRSPKSALILFLSINESNIISDRQKQRMTFKLLVKSEDIALLLLQNRADINVRDSKGNTVLHETKDPNVAKIAIKKGIDVDVKNNNDETPLQTTKYSSTAQVLIDYGANITIKDNLDNTLLHLTESPQVAKALIENGIEPNTKNKQGVTTLHNAWKNLYREDLASILIDAGADVNIRDDRGRTPLHTAVIGKTYIYYIELLMKAGANINLEDNYGKTSLDYAKAIRRQKLIDLLNSYSSYDMNTNS